MTEFKHFMRESVLVLYRDYLIEAAIKTPNNSCFDINLENVKFVLEKYQNSEEETFSKDHIAIVHVQPKEKDTECCSEYFDFIQRFNEAFSHSTNFYAAYYGPDGWVFQGYKILNCDCGTPVVFECDDDFKFSTDVKKTAFSLSYGLVDEFEEHPPA